MLLNLCKSYNMAFGNFSETYKNRNPKIRRIITIVSI